MSQELQQNRYDQLLRRVGGLIGGGSKVSEVLGELFPVIEVERLPGELYLLAGTRLAFGSISPTGAAGESARTQLFNPADSGQLITVESCLVATVNLQIVRYTVSNAALTTGSGTGRFRDSRMGVTQLPVGQIRQDSTVALTDATGQYSVNANTPTRLPGPNGLAVLSPGFGFEVGATNAATRIFVTFTWRERVAEQSELNL